VAKLSNSRIDTGGGDHQVRVICKRLVGYIPGSEGGYLPPKMCDRRRWRQDVFSESKLYLNRSHAKAYRYQPEGNHQEQQLPYQASLQMPHPR